MGEGGREGGREGGIMTEEEVGEGRGGGEENRRESVCPPDVTRSG